MATDGVSQNGVGPKSPRLLEAWPCSSSYPGPKENSLQPIRASVRGGPVGSKTHHFID